MNYNQEQPNQIAQNYIRQKQFDNAITYLENIIETNHDNYEYYYYLGLSYLLKEDSETAESIWMTALLHSNDFDIQRENLLTILNTEGSYFINQNYLNEAFSIYYQIYQLINDEEKPKQSWAPYYNNIGRVFHKLNYINDALKAYHSALELDDTFISVKINLGILYSTTKDLEKAEYYFREVIKLDPNNSLAYNRLLFLLDGQLRDQESIEIAQKLSQKFPDNLFCKLVIDLQLPALYNNQEEVLPWRHKWTQGLEKLITEKDLTQTTQQDVSALSSKTNFRLAYQGLNDVDLQKKYGSFVYEIVKSNFPNFVKLPDKAHKNHNEKIKIGYLSNCFRSHTVGKLSRGWFEKYNRDQFEVHCYFINLNRDTFTYWIEEQCDHFHYLPPNVETIAKKIQEDNLDILVVMEIGMHPMMNLIGSLRLAPIQCTTWLHPVTSGLVNIDYFLSSDLMEPENAQSHYSEKLIRLPNIGISYPKPEIPITTKSKQDFGLAENKISYLCCQSLFKYLPRHDYLIPSIAHKLPSAQFVFMERPNAQFANRFKQRLQKSFDTFNLNADDYCVFVPFLSQQEYFELNLVCDIFLDSLAWSGGNTTLEALACNLPVVTYPCEFMRGRHSYGILRMLGVNETIASSEQEYIDIAVKLGKDTSWRNEIVEKIKNNHDNVYDDLECIKGLENFYKNVV